LHHFCPGIVLSHLLWITSSSKQFLLVVPESQPPFKEMDCNNGIFSIDCKNAAIWSPAGKILHLMLKSETVKTRF
jgi:hypothetical protein